MLDNWIYNFKESDYEKKNRKFLLTSIDLELSRRCNLNCGYCYTDAGKALNNELTLNEIIKLIDDNKKLGLKSVTIVGGGEPFLVDYLERLINFLYNENLHCAVITNGTLIDEEKANFLFVRGVALCIKCNSIENPEIFDNMVGEIKGTFEKVHNIIKLLLKLGYARSDGPYLAIESIVCRENINEIPKIWRWARNNNILPIIEYVTPQGRARDNRRFLISKEEIRKLFSALSNIDRNEYNFHWEPLPSIAGSPCRRLYYSCYITSIGNVCPCAGIDIAMGNIRENPLQKILSKSQLLRCLRRPHLYLEGKCSQCELKRICYGCRGKAFCQTGDPLAEDPFCWR